ncbi:alpha/beta hydrolase [Ponticaulis sp.]|uniref:RBBP9/YdeN family alpha/beta hydrolase n=1 Tax=Ponticaulis sp. TaxID=2020902 RepID=UPI000B673633|nr:alpha/beta hydrolase [Ponticaulis sp.]MAI90942.1 alpha/beta hydrolase [Ponticaulis sp.]OUX98285.1 MAG: hypothetical protein CBB65_10895 [Hyphomonadaceae bacterium TMED5]|tara:strand:+ start:21581 stop:22222 length:642 start_codon:yes stop_codon:yes gene_type:complete
MFKLTTVIAGLVALFAGHSTACAESSASEVVIVHGYMAGPDEHWFPWLSDAAQAEGFEARRLALPDADNPDAQTWRSVIAQDIAGASESTFIVAHSLGSISTLRALSDLPADTRIGGLVLVSGFYDTLDVIPALDEFLDSGVDFDRVNEMVDACVVITARNDELVPYQLSDRLAAAMGCKLIVLNEGGHFLGSDGYTEFPLVLNELMRLRGEE